MSAIYADSKLYDPRRPTLTPYRARARRRGFRLPLSVSVLEWACAIAIIGVYGAAGFVLQVVR